MIRSLQAIYVLYCKCIESVIFPEMCVSLLSMHLSRQYIERTELKRIRYKILEFNPMVLRGKVRPDSSRPDLLHPVSSGFGFGSCIDTCGKFYMYRRSSKVCSVSKR